MEKTTRGPRLNLFLCSFSQFPSPAILMVLFSLFLIGPPTISAFSANAPAKSDSFTPPDNYLLDCGSSAQTTLPDKRVFLSDGNSTKFLSYNGRDTPVSTSSADVPLPIYLTAKVFVSEATYTFHVTKPGWHWVRLHFFSVQNNEFNLYHSKFSVNSDKHDVSRDTGCPYADTSQLDHRRANNQLRSSYTYRLTSE